MSLPLFELWNPPWGRGSIWLSLFADFPLLSYYNWYAWLSSVGRCPVLYKGLHIPYQYLRMDASVYLADHLIPASDTAPRRLRLWSANRNRLTVPRCRLSTYGCRTFYHADPTVWNSLPDELRNL